MKNILIATLSALVPLAAFPHDPPAHAAPKTVTKEQKPWGIAADAKAARRTIELTMSDNMRFTPALVEVTQGDVVKFVVRNRGKMLHEMVIGTRGDLEKHAQLMVKFPGMVHDSPYMVHVKPGAAGDLVWNFNRAGEFDFACLVAGHHEAGMVGKIRVVPLAGPEKPKGMKS